MKNEDIKSQIRPGGLRYEAKASGTSFPGSFGLTMSCFHCGKHVPRSRMETFNVAGRPQYRCKGGCQPATPAA